MTLSLRSLQSLPVATLAAAVVGVAAAGSSFAAAHAALPPVHHEGAVEYLSGGIGSDEARAIEQAAGRWPLMLEFAVRGRPHAAFAADVDVAVRDARHHVVLHMAASGPLMLARLAPGRYVVEARYAGRVVTRSVRVVAGQPARATLLWPAGTGESHG